VEVALVPCLRDNYAYVLYPAGGKAAVIVDPSEAAPVLAVLDRLGLSPVAILATHHHADHVGGNLELRTRHPKLRIFGFAGDRERIPGLSDALHDGQTFEIGSASFTALHIPGHTRGALAYVTDGVVFTGDTLFGAGCGRLFEGTPAQMYRSLNETLAALPEETRVFCGHEYTVNNLRFAQQLEPGNADVAERLRRASALREQGEATLPSTLGEERRTNPFLRCSEPSLLDALAGQLGADRSPVAVLALLRRLKDAF
jgi:hydroxyacylglutathione hydrolase